MNEKQYYPRHPFTIAIQAIAPVIGCAFNMHVLKTEEDWTDKEAFPLIEYAPIQSSNNTFSPGENIWTTTLVVQLNIFMAESSVAQYCEREHLEDAQDRHALFNNLEGKLKSFVTLLTTPSNLSDDLRRQDFTYYKYNWRLVNWLNTFFMNKVGSDELTGVSATIELSYKDVDWDFCCIRNNNEQLLCILEEGSVSYKRIENQL